MNNPLMCLMIFALGPMEMSANAQQIPVGMKQYQFVFLRTGPNTNQQEAGVTDMQEAHLALLARLNRERVNLLYGPFLEKTDLRGIVVLDLPDAAAARKALEKDPFVKEGHLVLDVKPWLAETNLFGLPDSPNTPEQFALGFLMSGTNRIQTAADVEVIQAGHLAYLRDLRKQGKLVVAGPFAEDTNWRGIFIYRVKTVEEAKELAAGDPAVKAGRLTIDARPWMTFKGMLK